MADAKGTRKAPKFKPIFAVMQVVDDNGSPVAFDKTKLNIIAGGKDTESVLDALEDNVHAFAKKVTL